MLQLLKTGFFILCFLSLSVPYASLAAPANDIHQVTVTVPDRSDAARNAAFKSAFSEVLIKMSGNPHVMTLPIIQNATPNLQQWVQSYTYVTPSEDDQSKTLQLQIQFDRQGITQLLRESKQAVLSSDRPLTLIYIDANPEQWQPMIQSLATAYGVPVIFPEMDLTDQTIIQSSTDAMTPLSKRYGVSSVLMVHVVAEQDQPVNLQGQYTINGNTVRWTVSGKNNQQIAQRLVARLMDTMMQQLSSNDNSALSSTVTLGVLGVNTVTDYTNVIRYLHEREDVMDVSVKEVGDTGVLLIVHITGDVAHFQKLLANDGRLKAADSPMAQNVNRADLYYYWS